MSKPDFCKLELMGVPGGTVVVLSDGKLLGKLFCQGGVFCVELYPQVVRTIGREDEPE